MVGDEVFSDQQQQKLYHFIPKDKVNFLPQEICVGDYLYDDTDVLFVYEGEGARLDENDVPIDDEEYVVFVDVGQSSALKRKVWDIKGKNIQQAMAINSILDPDVHITILLGSAGTGKTLITMACALDLVLEDKHKSKQYKRIIFSKTQILNLRILVSYQVLRWKK